MEMYVNENERFEWSGPGWYAGVVTSTGTETRRVSDSIIRRVNQTYPSWWSERDIVNLAARMCGLGGVRWYDSPLELGSGWLSR